MEWTCSFCSRLDDLRIWALEPLVIYVQAAAGFLTSPEASEIVVRRRSSSLTTGRFNRRGLTGSPQPVVDGRRFVPLHPALLREPSGAQDKRGAVVRRLEGHRRTASARAIARPVQPLDDIAVLVKDLEAGRGSSWPRRIRR